MQRYEVLILAVPEITKDELKQMENQLDRLITDAKGSTLSFERWGKFKLTYPVRGNEYGVYCLMRFEAPGSLIKDMRDFFAVKLHDIAMRHVIARVAGDSLVYQRPKSLEEASTSRDVDTFLKENQMGGLLSSIDEKADKGSRKEVEQPLKDDSVNDDQETETPSAEQ